jgi:hypothetical protein
MLRQNDVVPGETADPKKPGNNRPDSYAADLKN